MWLKNTKLSRDINFNNSGNDFLSSIVLRCFTRLIFTHLSQLTRRAISINLLVFEANPKLRSKVFCDVWLSEACKLLPEGISDVKSNRSQTISIIGLESLEGWEYPEKAGSRRGSRKQSHFLIVFRVYCLLFYFFIIFSQRANPLRPNWKTLMDFSSPFPGPRNCRRNEAKKLETSSKTCFSFLLKNFSALSR